MDIQAKDLTKAFYFKEQTLYLYENELDKWWSIETKHKWGEPTGEVKYVKVTKEQAKHLKTDKKNDKVRYAVPTSYFQDSIGSLSSNVLQETRVVKQDNTTGIKVPNTPQTAKQDELVNPQVLKEFIIASIQYHGEQNALNNIRTLVLLAKEYDEHVY